MNWNYLLENQKGPVPILDDAIPFSRYVPIDLSGSNNQLTAIDISKPLECQNYIDNILKVTNGQIAFGGYLEKRNLYKSAKRFSEGEVRDIHLGVDFWCEAGTAVLVPLDGKVHSFQNNADLGNYGPTIILEHFIEGHTLYSLYGHLSLESLKDLYKGKGFVKGEVLATLGETAINVNYAPHLHFQLILDLGDFNGDYPGVCSKNELGFYKKNCPDPNLLLGFSLG